MRGVGVWLFVMVLAPVAGGAQEVALPPSLIDDLDAARTTLEDLGQRFVGTEILRGGRTFRDVGALLESRRIRGLSVLRHPGNAHGGEVPMCVMQGRFREGDPATGCMALMMDGRELSQAQAETIAPERLAAVVVLTRREATRLLGSLGRRGAVLLYPPGGSP